MLKIAAPLCTRYIYCLLHYVITWLQYLSSQSARDELEAKLQGIRDGLKASSGALSRCRFISGWRAVIRQAEQEYVTSTVENIDTGAIAWLMESSTNATHIHAAIRATAGLALTEERLLNLEDADAKGIILSCIEALTQRYRGVNWTKFNTDDAMTMVAGSRYIVLLNESYIDIGHLRDHEDPNIACLAQCAESHHDLREHMPPDCRLRWSERIFREHTDTLRKRVLITLFDTLRHRMLMPATEHFPTYNLDPETIDVTLLLLEQRIYPSWRSDEDAKDDVGRAILSMWYSQPAVAGQSTPLVPGDVSSYVRVTLGALAAFLAPRSSDERCLAVSEVIGALLLQDLLPFTDDGHGLTLLHNIHNSVIGALVSVERPRQVWMTVSDVIHTFHECNIRSPHEDEPSFARACAHHVSQTPQISIKLFSMNIARDSFWDALSECTQEATVGELRNIGQTLAEFKVCEGGMQCAQEIFKSSILSAVGNRIRSLYPASRSDFEDDDFLLLTFFTDISARLHLDGSSRGSAAFSGIVSSLVHAWEVLTEACGQAWLDELIAFWQVHEPALWKGDTDEARLDSLTERCVATRLYKKPLIGHLDANELLFQYSNF
ncbi:hypothetical protein BOTBODRAFT_179580 [Botryobasidium botryosum FD-172 SS1]|uniref:Uncharacterized protein n=1 Tax=Botryobasidium botryosum (strain FD-172 SS1) TaxID=930990 RepID=A0A067M265_BOTB1|nr:hypothetical protein BOTBODRAFT_179580 [Botryobasidium botryosum FD-172 SS1]